MPFSIDFDRRLAQRTVDDAHRTILIWLQGQKATVKDARPPTYIEATHGRALQPMGWRKDARKTLAFELRPEGPDVLVSVRIIPPMLNVTDVQMRSDEARANWNELLADLWVQFGDKGTLAEAMQRPPGDWNAALARGKSLIWVGVGFLAVGAIVFVAFLTFSPSFILVPTGLFVGGVLALLYGGMTVQAAKRRLARQTQPE